MFLSQTYIQSNEHGYQYDVLPFSDINQAASPNRKFFVPGLMPFTKLTNLIFLRIHMFVKELKNECQNYQWRRNRQGHP